MRARVTEKVAEIAQKEVRAVVPAALRAVRHGVNAALRKFPQEYAKERKKL